MTDEELNEMTRRMNLQNAEFDALDKLMDATQAHHATPVVDDDYPAVRHQYEGALAAFVLAMKANGRFDHRGNPFGVINVDLVEA